MRLKTLRIATRQSPLALWQTGVVKKALNYFYPLLDIQICPLSTEGDQIQDKPLRLVGGKGLFIKKLEEALLDGSVDMAIHSMKDVPAGLDPAFEIAAILQRENPLDAWVSVEYPIFDQLPKGAVIGTSSLRRQAQLLALRPDLNIVPLRGNVGTRLNAVEIGKIAGTVLAACGLRRLNLEHKIKYLFTPEVLMPAVGQGAIGVEILSDQQEIKDLLRPINHPVSYQLVMIERAMCLELNGSCHSPIGGLAEFTGHEFKLTGRVAHALGEKILTASQSTAELGCLEDPVLLGHQVGKTLLSMGARAYL